MLSTRMSGEFRALLNGSTLAYLGRVRAHACQGCPNELCPSDHLPLMADFEWRPTPPEPAA